MSTESISQLVDISLEEDFSQQGDVTSLALFDQSVEGNISIVSRSKGIISGCSVAQLVFEKVDTNINVEWIKNDGDKCSVGEQIAILSGSLASILKAERTVLNFLCHLSGVATYTNNFVTLLEEIGSTTKVRDTRKTTPGYRALEKQAVVHGGGVNHRMGLYDAFLVKDNHLQGVSIGEVVEKCRRFDNSIPLEVEVDSIAQLKEVATHKPDLILLDNFSTEMIYNALSLDLDIPFEISGGVNLSNLDEYGMTNIKYIAIGAITHSAPILDIGFDVI